MCRSELRIERDRFLHRSFGFRILLLLEENFPEQERRQRTLRIFLEIMTDPSNGRLELLRGNVEVDQAFDGREVIRIYLQCIFKSLPGLRESILLAKNCTKQLVPLWIVGKSLRDRVIDRPGVVQITAA